MRARSTQCNERGVPSDRDAERRGAHETVRRSCRGLHATSEPKRTPPQFCDGCCAVATVAALLTDACAAFEREEGVQTRVASLLLSDSLGPFQQAQILAAVAA